MKHQSDGRMTKLANIAFRRAAITVIERAEQWGTPVIVWKNQKMCRLNPHAARNDWAPIRERNGYP
jgi:hypothetical protein